MRLLAAFAFVLAAAAGAPGCLRCTPELDVRHCLPDGCAPNGDGDPVVESDDARLAAWPDVRRLIDATGPGDHSHTDWNATAERAFWTVFGVPHEKADKELWVRHDGEFYRVRVLSC